MNILKFLSSRDPPINFTSNLLIEMIFFHTFAALLRRLVKYWSALSLLLFAFFFASTNLFTHVHEGENGRIVHSHPWSANSHSHTDAQYQTILLLSGYTFQQENEFHLEVPYLTAKVELSTPFSEIRISNLIEHILGFRAPPALL